MDMSRLVAACVELPHGLYLTTHYLLYCLQQTRYCILLELFSWHSRYIHCYTYSTTIFHLSFRRNLYPSFPFLFFVLFLSSSFSRIFFLSLQQTIHISLSFALSRGQPPFILCLALSPFCPFTDVSIFSPLSNILLPWDPISLLWCCSFPHLPFSIFLVPSVSLVSFKFFSLLGITRCCEKYRLFRQRISIQRFLKLDVLSCKFKRHVIAVTVQSGFYRPEFSRNTSLIAGT